MKSWLLELTPLAAMVVLQFLDVGLSTISKAAMSKGMSRIVFIVYSNALATLILLPYAIIVERFIYFFFPTSSLCSFVADQENPTFAFILFFCAERRGQHSTSLFSVNSSSLALPGMSLHVWISNVSFTFFKICKALRVLQGNYDAELCIYWHRLQLSYTCFCYKQLGSSFHFRAWCNLQVLFP